MTALTDRIAEVLWAHQYHRPNRGCLCGWEIDASDPMNPTHMETHMAERVAAELNLTEEWGVQITEGDKTVIETHPGMGEPLDRDTAFYENRRWPSFGYNTEGVRRRWVSEWAPVEEAS